MTQRIAVIGSGMAGLTAAYRCRQSGFAVTLFESRSGHGMSAHTLELDGGRVDVPLRVLGESQWDQTLALAHEAGVDSYAVDVRLSCSWLNGRTWLRTCYLPVTGWPMVGSWRQLGPRSLKCALGMARLIRATRRLQPAERALSLAEFAEQHQPDRLFWRGLILQILGTICTCPDRQLEAWPSGQLLDLLDSILHRGQLRRLSGGTARLAAALGAGVRLQSGSPVVSVEPVDDEVWVETADQRAVFDRVIIATQANQLGFLRGPRFSEERACLAQVPYVDGELVVHRDARAMPPRRSDWTALNFLMDRSLERSMFTVWVNAVEPSLAGTAPVFQSWDPIIPLDPALVIQRFPLQRAVVNRDSLDIPATVRTWHRQPGRRVFYCGSWAHEGVPMLETAVRSAQAVVEQIRAQPSGSSLTRGDVRRAATASARAAGRAGP